MNRPNNFDVLYYIAVKNIARAAAAQVAAIVAADSVKSVKGVADDFETTLTEFCVQAFEGRMDKVDFQRALRQLIRQAGPDIYIEGMIAGGAENAAEARADMTEEDEAMIDGYIQSQLPFVNGFAKDVVAARTADDRTAAQEEIFRRCTLWREALETLGGNANASAAGDIYLTYDGEDGEENCDECRKYKGQRHRQSWWVSRNLVERNGNENYTCGRWHNCRHGFYDDNGKLIIP